MKALLDHNLPPRLLALLRGWSWVTQAQHVIEVGWAEAADLAIWNACSAEPTVIFTKDKDFGLLSATLGFPPKVVLLRLGNCSTTELEARLALSADDVAGFVIDPTKGLLILERDNRRIDG